MSDPAGDTIFDRLDQVSGTSGYRRTMGLRIVRAPQDDPTAAIVECEVSPPYANTQNVAHGGLISGLIDTAAGPTMYSPHDLATLVAV